jgi:DNA polymerase-3 subunit delta'
MGLRDVIGQGAAIAALRSAIARDAVPQACLFVGPEGTGKATAAVEFAKALDCLKRRPDGDACDDCVNCTRIQAGEHPDMTRVAPDGEFTRIWQIWTRPGHGPGALETLPFAPVAGRVRFYLIEKAETLNEESANSLLKALEEPPPYAQFVLCAPSPTAVLPTILSRCQMIRFSQTPTAVIAEALTRLRGLPTAEARVLAAYSEGALGRALRLSDAPELRAQRDTLLDLASRIAAGPRIAAFRLAEDLRAAAKPARPKKGDDAGDADAADRTARGDMGRALGVLAVWNSDLLSIALCGPNAPVVHEDRRPALTLAAARYRPEQLAGNIEQLLKFRRHIARNANAQLTTEVLMLKLIPRKTP